ncbi:MAG: hypothetical protein WA828_02880 [Coleofasciculaceae cyanobacterium]
MKNGQCPKCNSHWVYSGEEVPLKCGINCINCIPLTGGIQPKYAALDNYVCAKCGYVESYISDPELLLFIAENWPPARRS